MAQFDYTAKSRDGKSISGTVDAADRRGAISAVERLGLAPLLVTEKSEAAKKKLKAEIGRAHV